MNCFRYLDFKSFDEVDQLTVPEYNLLMKAVELKNVDTDCRLHMQAFLNFAVKAEKKVGKRRTKPVFQKFGKFYDYEREVQKVLKNDGKKKSRFPGLGKLLKKGGGELGR